MTWTSKKHYNFNATKLSNSLDDVHAYGIADSKLYTADNAENLSKIKFITRIPNSNKQVTTAIKAALDLNDWVILDDKNRYHVIETEHIGIKQRWVIVYSTAANGRAQKRIEKKIQAEATAFNAQVKAFNKQKYTSKDDLTSVILSAVQKLRFHAAEFNIETLKVKGSLNTSVSYKATATLAVQFDKKQEYIEAKSCYVIGSNADAGELSAIEVLAKYKNQNSTIENMGFRFLKDPLFFASSLFVKLPRRIEALIFIMTLSLLVYSIAQKKLRDILQEKNISIPDQLNKPTQKPTIRWVFQLLTGINVVYVTVAGVTKKIIEGINLIKSNIIMLFDASVRKIYGFQT